MRGRAPFDLDDLTVAQSVVVRSFCHVDNEAAPVFFGSSDHQPLPGTRKAHLTRVALMGRCPEWSRRWLQTEKLSRLTSVSQVDREASTADFLTASRQISRCSISRDFVPFSSPESPSHSTDEIA